MLKGAAATGLALAGASLWADTPASAADMTAVQNIFTVARTAEQLAVTFYTNGLRNANALRFGPRTRQRLEAALIEEQIHQQFFTANGGQSLADTFSFPNGERTFFDVRLFVETQQQLEGVFDSAFLAAVREFAELGQPRFAQIAAQIACVEAEHRVLGRVILGAEPADNFTYTPVLVNYVADAPNLVKQSGYLSPVPGNTFTYAAVNTNDPNILYKDGPSATRQ